MEIAALVISIVAVLTSVGSVWYARAAARAAERTIRLEHGVRFVVEIRHPASVSTATITRKLGETARPPTAGRTGGRPLLHLRNVGGGTALQVAVTVNGIPRKVSGAMLGPGDSYSLGTAPHPIPRVHVSWVTSEGREESALLDPIDVR